MKRRKVMTVVGVVLVTIYGFLVWHINATAEVIPEERYEPGEWLPIEDGYIIDETLELNDGYSVRFDGASIMSPAEFVERFGTQERPGPFPEGGDDTVLAVTLTLKNEGNTEGGFFGYMWQVVPDTNDRAYAVDEELFAYAEPTGLEFRIKENTERQVTFPFTWQEEPLFAQLSTYRRGKISGDRFSLVLTCRPERKSLVFQL